MVHRSQRDGWAAYNQSLYNRDQQDHRHTCGRAARWKAGTWPMADRGGCLSARTGGGSSCQPRQDMLDRLSLLLCSRELLGHVTSYVAEEASLGYRNLEEPNFVSIPMSTRHSQRWRSWTQRPCHNLRRSWREVRSGTELFQNFWIVTTPCMSLSAFSLKNLQ